MAIPAPRPGAAALITGASSGIGEAIARELAARGHNAVIVARRRDRLDVLAEELRARGSGRVEVLCSDVADADARKVLLADLAALDLEIDIAVLSAGFGMGGPLVDSDPERIVQMVRTNVEATMILSHALIREMAPRRQGALMLVSSLAGNQPMPHFGAYAATKAAVTSFAEMLSEEVRRDGITVTALCPGGVRTEFSDVAGMTSTESSMPGAFMIDPGPLAVAALAGLEAGNRVVMPKAAVRALAYFGAHAPRRIWLPICRRLMSL